MKNKLILNNKTQLDEAIKLLDLNGNGILPVVNNENILLGIITDGDIRKAILNNKLDLEHIINRDPYKLNESKSKEFIVSYLKKIHRRQIPLVDNENKFKSIFTLDDVNFNYCSNWVVIMAGGLGKRLGELTKNTPKPMLKVGDSPILEHILKMFISHGYTNFFISVNFKAHDIKKYFGNGSNLGAQIEYLEENKRLGTGGSLSLIDIDLQDPFFVVNGDVLSTMNYEDLMTFHKKNGSLATICVKKESFKFPYGVVDSDSDNNFKCIREKPLIEFFINTGIYVLDPKVLKNIPKNKFFDLPDLFSSLEDKKVKTFELKDYWIDIGNTDNYNSINNKMNFK